MAYITNSDVSAEFKNIVFNATSAVTDTEVDNFIEEEEAVINVTIANRYETPVTDADAIALLKRISLAFTAYRVAKVLNLKKDIPIPEKMVAQTIGDGSFYRTAQKQLNDIKDGVIVFINATTRSASQGVKDYNSNNDISSVWERDVKQW